MSRRLRGQTTLQSIIGRSTINKKPSTGLGKKTNPRKPLNNSSSAPVGPILENEGARTKKDTGKPVPEGCVKCPICQAVHKEDAINLHIDKCLARQQASANASNQATLSHFTRGSAQKSKRSKTGQASSCPQPPSQSAELPNKEIYASPKRKLSRGSARGSQANEGCHGLDPMLPVRPPPTPFEPTSQEKAFATPSSVPEDTLETKHNMFPDSGRGGDASTSEKSSHPDGVIMITQAVGRRYNSNGVVKLGQVGRLEREVTNPKDRNALLILAKPPGGVLGYLPRRVAQHLSELVQSNLVGSKATVMQLPIKSTSPLDIHLEVWPLEIQEGLNDKLEKARAAAEAQRSDNLERSSSGTGQILRANFLLLLEAVLEQDKHLLSEEELAFVEAYRKLKEEPQMLFLRLFLRSGPWFKLNGLSFSECKDILAAALELEEAGLAENLGRIAQMQRKDAVKCMTVLEIQSVLAALDLQPKKDAKSRPPVKAQLVEILANALDSRNQGEEAFQTMLKMTGPCLRLSQSSCESIKRLQRLFFLNEGQGLSHFLVQDLGFMRYPAYTVERTRAVFPSRQALLEYEEALHLAAVVDNALEREIGEDMPQAERALAPALRAIEDGKHKALDLPSSDFLMRFSAASIFTTMATIAVSIMEKQKRYSEACDLLRKLLGGRCCPGRRGEWWTRLTLNLSTHLKRWEEALETAESALADDWVKHGDRLDLQRRLLRLAQPPRRWKTYPWARSAKREPKEVRIEAMPLPNVLGIKSRFPCDNSEGHCSVEQLALQWYAEESHGNWKGVHAEGGIWSTLFGLLMWEVLFMPVPNVFRTKFQTCPLDLQSPSFYPARRQAIEVELQKIREGHAPEMIRARWDNSNGVMCVGVNWGKYDAHQLAEIAGCIGGPGLAAVCNLLAEDRSGWQGGMPDLLLWNPDRQLAKLSEVKGPRDTLSMQQRAWLNALSEARIDVEVFKVVEPGTGQKARGRQKY